MNCVDRSVSIKTIEANHSLHHAPFKFDVRVVTQKCFFLFIKRILIVYHLRAHVICMMTNSTHQMLCSVAIIDGCQNLLFLDKINTNLFINTRIYAKLVATVDVVAVKFQRLLQSLIHRWCVYIAKRMAYLFSLEPDRASTFTNSAIKCFCIEYFLDSLLFSFYVTYHCGSHTNLDYLLYMLVRHPYEWNVNKSYNNIHGCACACMCVILSVVTHDSDEWIDEKKIQRDYSIRLIIIIVKNAKRNFFKIMQNSNFISDFSSKKTTSIVLIFSFGIELKAGALIWDPDDLIIFPYDSKSNQYIGQSAV